MSYQHQVLGTVIASTLNYDQLCQAIGESPLVNPSTSSFAPCDGRAVAGSMLARVTGNSNVPDLRGKFLRGLNLMYSVGQPLPFDPNSHGDTQPNRIVGDYQKDSVIIHSHPYTHFNGGVITDMSNDKDQRRCSYGNMVPDQTGTYGDAPETKPRNISVYYYIKIN